MQKANKQCSLRNTGENPELHKLGRGGKKIVMEETVFQILRRYLETQEARGN